MSTTHHSTADGAPIDHDVVEALTDTAEQGYDLEEILSRHPGVAPPACHSVETGDAFVAAATSRLAPPTGPP